MKQQGKVFLPQVTLRPDPIAGLVPVYDFTAAAAFGEITVMLDKTDKTSDVAATYAKVAKSLANFTENDYLLAVGDPSLIAICAGVIARKIGKLRILKWDRRFKTYSLMEVILDGN